MNPFDVVRDFERGLADYAGAPFCVTTTSCTMAILLACAWYRHQRGHYIPPYAIEVPARTYVGVAHSVRHADWNIAFVDEHWVGEYRLHPLPVWDSARWLRAGMFNFGMKCVSLHHTKHLGISTHGGAILHDDPLADGWLRRARFDGRTEGVTPKDDRFTQLGWHCYLTPPAAAEGLLRLASLPKYNDPLPWGPGTSSDYPDLSQMEVFK